MNRIFLDRRADAVTSTIDFLYQNYIGSDKSDWDLSNVIVVAPSGRVRKELLNGLLCAAENVNAILNLPQITTIGQMPEMLYRQSKPIADIITQQLAWHKAAAQSNESKRKDYLPVMPEQSDLTGQLVLGRMLQRLHEDLSAEGFDFNSVVNKLANIEQDKVFRADFETFNLKTEIERWKYFTTIEKLYLKILDSHNLWDKNAARRFALAHPNPGSNGINGDFDTSFDIIMAGIVDLNRIQKDILSRVGSHVTALIYAPESEANLFDEFGALSIEKWTDELRCPLSDSQIVQVEKPMDQVLCAFDFIESLHGKYSAEEITLGAPDPKIATYVQSAAQKFNLTVDDSIGKPLSQTPPYLLLQAVAEFLRFGDINSFAALVRHPYVHKALQAKIKGVGKYDILSSLDNYQADRLPFTMKSGVIENLKETYSCSAGDIQNVRAAAHWVRMWLADFHKPELEARQIRQLVAKLFSELPRDERAVNNLAAAMLIKVGEKFETIPADLTGKLTPEDALRLILKRLELLNLPDDEEQITTQQDEEEFMAGLNPESAPTEHINLAGWLELVWDRAPVLILLSFNEGIVPKSINANLFLPNQLRKYLGIMDNDRRMARDVWTLYALAHSGKKLRVICSLRDTEDKPLLPSRLLFNKDNPQFALQALRFFDEKTTRPHYKIAEDDSSFIPAASQREEARNWAVENLSGETFRGLVSKISATKFSDYLKCPFRFYLKYVVGIQPSDYALQELPPSSFGTTVHEVLQRWAMEEIETRSNAWRLKPDDLYKKLSGILDEYFASLFPSSVQPGVILQKEVLRQRLRSFANFQANWEGEIIAAEQTYEEPVQLSDGSIMTLQGKIDRIDRLPDGSVVLLDYKTSDSVKTPDAMHRDKEGNWTSLQLPVYRRVIDFNRKKLHLGKADIRVGYINISRENLAKFEEPSWDSTVFNEAENVMLSVMERVHEGIFWSPASGEVKYDLFPEYVAWITGN